MSALDRIDAWIEEAEAIRRLVEGSDTIAESIIATRAAALRDARDLFAPEYEEAVEELDEDPQDQPADSEEPAPDNAAEDQVAAMPFEDPAREEASPPPTPSRVAPSARAPESGQPHKPPRRQSPTWTPEREALAVRMLGEGATAGQVRDACNALPGPDIASVDSTQVYLHKLKKRMQAAAEAPTESAPAPAPAAAPHPLSSLSEDELADARKIVLDPAKGARDLAEDFGWPLARAQDIAAAIRAEQKARAA